MDIIERFVPLKIKSGNQLKGGHWSRMHNYTKKIHKDIAWFFLPRDKPEDVYKKHVSVEVVRVLSKGEKRFDEDNLGWGFKPVFDFLKQNGWIYEDSPDWITRKYGQVRAKDVGLKETEFGFIVRIDYN